MTRKSDIAQLQALVTRTLGGDHRLDGIRVTSRRTFHYESSNSAQVVDCVVGGRPETLLVKQSAAHDHSAFGHRGGLRREARVYRDVLAKAGLTVPRIVGSVEMPDGGSCLLLEYLEHAVRISKVPEKVPEAAAWIGSLHGWYEGHQAARDYASWLPTYDAPYYRSWALRTLGFTSKRGRYPWLAKLCTHVAENAGTVFNVPTTMIHGEFYPHNILWNQGSVYPVDWESAAIGPGEIDLASLTEGWDSDVTDECVRRYADARWPSGPPPNLTRRFDLAQLYLSLRWLGESTEETNRARSRPLFSQLEKLATRLELIS